MHTTHSRLPMLSYHTAILVQSLFNHLWQSLYAPAGPGRFLGLTYSLVPQQRPAGTALSLDNFLRASKLLLITW